MDEIQDNKPVRKSRRAVAETAAPAEATESASKKTRTRGSKPAEDKSEPTEARAPRENSSSDSSSSDSNSNSEGGERRRNRDFDDERRGGGRIVSMSSLNAHNGGVTSAVSKFAYAAAKAGIIGMTRALAKELGPEIAVNCICPGVIKTELGNSLTKSREPELIKGIALGRLGTPADVAQLVVFLATVEPNFMSGQDFKIDGYQWVT